MAEFWSVGRLTLEHWLVPRLAPGVVTTHAGCEVAEVSSDGDTVTLVLSDASTLVVDHVVFATGYRADFNDVPYLGPVLDQVTVTDGWPELDEGFRDVVAGFVRDRVCVDPRLRALLRIHQRLPLSGADRRRRDARVTIGSSPSSRNPLGLRTVHLPGSGVSRTGGFSPGDRPRACRLGRSWICGRIAHPRVRRHSERLWRL